MCMQSSKAKLFGCSELLYVSHLEADSMVALEAEGEMDNSLDGRGAEAALSCCFSRRLCWCLAKH
jgi:hypothetical protein